MSVAIRSLIARPRFVACSDSPGWSVCPLQLHTRHLPAGRVRCTNRKYRRQRQLLV